MKLSGVQVGGTQSLAPIDIEAAGRVSRAETQADLAMIGAGIAVTNAATGMIDSTGAHDTANANAEHLKNMSVANSKYEGRQTISRAELEGMGITPNQEGDELPMYEYYPDIMDAESKNSIESVGNGFRFDDHKTSWGEDINMAREQRIATFRAKMPAEQKKYLTEVTLVAYQDDLDNGNYNAARERVRTMPQHKQAHYNEAINTAEELSIIDMAVTSEDLGYVKAMKKSLTTDYTGDLSSAQLRSSKVSLDARIDKLESKDKSKRVYTKANDAYLSMDGLTHAQKLEKAYNESDPEVGEKLVGMINSRESSKRVARTQGQVELQRREMTKMRANPNTYDAFDSDLDPERQQVIHNQQQNVAAGTDVKDNWKVKYNLEQMILFNPQGASEIDWTLYEDQLSGPTIAALQQAAENPTQTAGMKKPDSAIKMALKDAKIKPDSGNYYQMHATMMDMVAQAAKENGGVVTDQIIDDAVTNGLKTSEATTAGSLWGTNTGDISLNDIDADEQRIAKQYLKDNGIPISSEAILLVNGARAEAVSRFGENPTEAQFRGVMALMIAEGQ